MDIQTFLKNHRHQHIVIGLSGGLDSVVLLHLLAQARAAYGLTLTAVHVHHGLSVYADEWADFCAKLCAKWEILLHIKRIHVQTKWQGVEAAARVARYAVFTEQDADCVALAHHRDDQIETFFLAALRGSGVRGLAAMPDELEKSVSDSLKIVRPLLHFTRQDIQQYATLHQLPHIEDDSNHNPHFLRNWIRHHWLPPLRARLPHADEHLSSAIALLQEELSLINEINEQDSLKIHHQNQFQIAQWRNLSPVRRRQQLVLFAKQHQLGTPRRNSVLDCERILLDNNDGARWSLPYGQAVAYRGVLFALPQNWAQQFAWHKPITGSLKQFTQNHPITLAYHPFGLPDDILHDPNLTLRAAQAHDALPMKNGGSKPVKKILAQNGIPPFLREHYPILLDENGVCLAVLGLAVNQKIGVHDGILPTWTDAAKWTVMMSEK